MTSLAAYLAQLDEGGPDAQQRHWFGKLEPSVQKGIEIYEKIPEARRRQIDHAFLNWVRTEEIKAWYSEPDERGLFQGTSVTSITIPALYQDPLNFDSIQTVEEAIARSYIEQHDLHAPTVGKTIMESTEKWLSEGLFYGVVLGSKVISQAFGLAIDASEVVFKVGDVLVDPHEITSYTAKVREEYFQRCRERIGCFAGIPGLTQTELETALVLADISKPKLEQYREKILLAPVRCNEIAALLSRRVTKLIGEMTQGRIQPRSLMVTIYDTDTPYTYHQIAGYFGQSMCPIFPGLTVLGASGTIDAFRWLYAYRASLVAQKIMKGSLYSETTRRFTPFVFFGVLVERDAEILLDLDNLSRLRYRGNLSPRIEFAYMVPRLQEFLESTTPLTANADLTGRFR
jgi:hypothetical protein